MSHVMRKPVCAICEQRRCRPACTSAQSDQHLCRSLPRQYNISSFYIRNFKLLARFWSWAGRFESYLVANPEDRFSHAFIHVYSLRAGSDNPLGTNVDVNRKPLSLCPSVASFKWSLRNLILYTFLMILYMSSPVARADNPLGTNFWRQQKALLGTNVDVNRKPLSLCPFVASFKWSLRNLILYTFLMILYMPSLGARADSPLGTNFWRQQKALITLPICCRFKTNCFVSPILHTFYPCFTICI